MRDALATVNEKCDEAVKEATRQLNMLLLHRVGWQSITKRFKYVLIFVNKNFGGFRILDLIFLRGKKNKKI